MADIQSSLRRLQESIRGLSDASALVAPTPSVVTSEATSDGGESAVLFETSPRAASNHGSMSPPPSALQDATACEGRSAHNGAISSPSRRSYCVRSCGSGGSGGGGGSGSGSGCCAPIQGSFLSSIVGDLGDSAEARVARELEDLRAEKESLRVMKQQLAAVHQLRDDLQRKESVIQSLQLKVQEGHTVKDRAERLETHCRLLEERCLYLESSNAEYAERFGALDRESRVKIDGLLRNVDDLGRRLRDAEVELKAERRRFETGVAAHDRDLAVAMAEGADARGLAEDLNASLKEATAQAKRRKERYSEMEKLLTSQLDETRKLLARAEHRASAAIEARRLDSAAAIEAAAALERHLKAFLRKGGEAGPGRQGGDDYGEEECGSTEAFVELSGRWCGNEILALTWVAVSKALEGLDGARAGEAAAVWSLGEARRQVSEQQEEVGVLRAELADLRAELSRLNHVEERLKSTFVRVEAARESVCKRDRLADAVWTQLSLVGFISPRSPPGTPLESSLGRNEGSCLSNTRVVEPQGERGVGDLSFDSKEAEIMRGLKCLAADWKERGKAVQTLSERMRNERARLDSNKSRLETLAEEAKEEAGSKRAELARLSLEFQKRMASVEAQLSEKAAKAKDAAVAEAVRRLAQAQEEADRRLSEVADDARRKEAAASLEANRRVSAAEEALAKAEDTARTAKAETMAALERRRAVEAALRVLGRFVGPLRRLCLELREQKRFLARSYRQHAPLQTELFAVAAAVSGKDYWCLWRTCCHSSDRRCCGRSGRRWVACSAACNSSSSGIDFGADGKTQQAEVSASLPDVPPSLRAVVIAVIAANRFAWAARGSGFPRGVAGGAGGAGGRGGRRAEAVEAAGVASDARYVSNAAGARALPVLPAWCAAQALEMPRAGELEAMPDARALEFVLERLLVFDVEGAGIAAGSAQVSRGSAPRTRSRGFSKAEALWGVYAGVEGGAGGDLLRDLLRGRKDHMTRVKERGLALVDPRSLSGRNREGCVPLHRRACRVRLGRKVREEMERSLWLGEGPGQPASLHLRDIRKALAALARELNASEGKRLEFEGALRAAGGGVGIRELEKSAEALRRRVGLLEAEACSRPDKAAVSALAKEKEKASAEAAALEDQVRALEAAVMTAKRAVQQASAENDEMRLERDAAEERARKIEARRRELLGELDQLKEFARRASLERDECLERERAAARDRGGGGNSTSNTIRAGRAQGGGVEVMEQEPNWIAHAEELLRCSRKEEERLRSRCLQLEARMAESQGSEEKQRSVVESLRREAARAREEAERAKNQAQDTAEQKSLRESEHRRQLSVLEARLLEAGVKSTRRRDLLQLQASAQNDLRQALIDAMPAGAAVTLNGLNDDVGVSNASPARRNDPPLL